MKAMKRINDKEQHIMCDMDHKLSHDTIETAVTHNAKVIKLTCCAISFKNYKTT